MRSFKEVLTFEGVVCGYVIWMLLFLIYKGKFSFFVEFGLTLERRGPKRNKTLCERIFGRGRTTGMIL